MPVILPKDDKGKVYEVGHEVYLYQDGKCMAARIVSIGPLGGLTLVGRHNGRRYKRQAIAITRERR